MTKTKVTKKENLTNLRALVTGEVTVEHFNANELLAFIDNELEQLDKKAAAAKARAEKQKVAGDKLRDTIKGLLNTETFITLPDVVKALNDENITSQKVTPRLSQLVKLGMVERGEVKIPGVDGSKTRTITGYRLLA